MSYAAQAALEPPEPGPRLAAAFLVALALHAAALLGLVFWRSHEATKPPGEQEIAIDLAPAATEAPSVNAAEVARPLQPDAEIVAVAPPQEVVPEPTPADTLPPEEPATTAETVPAETVEAVTAEISEPVPADAAADTVEATTAPTVVAEEVATLTPEETATAQPLPEPVAKRPPPKQKAAEKPAPVRREVARRPARAPAAAPSTPQQGAASSSRENAGGSAAAADPNAQKRFADQIRAAVRNRHHYPPGAQGQAGGATVRFTVHRSGRVLDSSLVRSSGNAVLDQAALATVAPGSTLPAAPEAVPQPQFTFVVELRFDLK